MDQVTLTQKKTDFVFCRIMKTVYADRNIWRKYRTLSLLVLGMGK